MAYTLVRDIIANSSPATQPITCIVEHHAVATSFAVVKSAFLNNGTSAHFCIGDGVVYQYVDLSRRAWHAKNANPFSVGIEHLNTSASKPYPISDGVLQTSGEFHAWLAKQLGWTQLRVGKEIRFHSEFVATACPGQLRDNGGAQRIATIANSILNGSPITPTPKPEPIIITREDLPMEFLFSNRGAVYHVHGHSCRALKSSTELSVLNAVYNQCATHYKWDQNDLKHFDWSNNDATANAIKNLCNYDPAEDDK